MLGSHFQSQSVPLCDNYEPSMMPSSVAVANPRSNFTTIGLQDMKGHRRREAANMVMGGLMGRSSGSSVSTAKTASGKKKKQSTAQPRPQIKYLPGQIGPVHIYNHNDVLCGRGGRINAHSGNVQFREIVAQKKDEYLSEKTKKLEKAHIAAEIVRYIRDMEPNGRFLKEEKDGSWYDIGDQKAIKKVGQALREDAPKEGEEGQEGGKPEKKKTKSPKKSSSDKSSVGGTPKSSKSTAAATRPPQAQQTPEIQNSVTVPARVVSSSCSMLAPPTLQSSKSATAVSSRGGGRSNSGNVSRTSSGQLIQPEPHPSMSFDNTNGNNSLQLNLPQQQPGNNTDYFQNATTTTLPQSPDVGNNGMSYHVNQAFRGRSQRSGVAISGAAAAVMKQNNADNHEFEVPLARDNAQMKLGMFHPVNSDQQKEDHSMLSGFSCPSEMSGVSALTDMSLGNPNIINKAVQQQQAQQQARLDGLAQNWQQQQQVVPPVLESYSSSIIPQPQHQQQQQLQQQQSSTHFSSAGKIGDDMSWMEGSINGGASLGVSLGGLSDAIKAGDAFDPLPLDQEQQHQHQHEVPFQQQPQQQHQIYQQTQQQQHQPQIYQQQQQQPCPPQQQQQRYYTAETSVTDMLSVNGDAARTVFSVDDVSQDFSNLEFGAVTEI